MVWYQGGLKPERAARATWTSTKIANGAIFEGTKGAILADFTTRMIIPNNDDGDLTYYKRRSTGRLLPLIGGTGQVTQAPPAAAAPGRRQRRKRAPARSARQGLPAGFTAMPSAEPRPERFPRDPDARRAHSRRARAAESRGRSVLAARTPDAAAHRRRRLPAGMDRRLQRQEQQRRPRHQHQDALRFRLFRHA